MVFPSPLPGTPDESEQDLAGGPVGPDQEVAADHDAASDVNGVKIPQVSTR
jgi:hypothetical protein